MTDQDRRKLKGEMYIFLTLFYAFSVQRTAVESELGIRRRTVFRYIADLNSCLSHDVSLFIGRNGYIGTTTDLQNYWYDENDVLRPEPDEADQTRLQLHALLSLFFPLESYFWAYIQETVYGSSGGPDEFYDEDDNMRPLDYGLAEELYGPDFLTEKAVRDDYLGILLSAVHLLITSGRM